MRSLRILSIGTLLFIPMTVQAADMYHDHPAADALVHEEFYKDWKRPDNPDASCCSNKDCYPTRVKYIDGKLYMERREDKKFIYVPPNKLERDRESPDGRSHLCAPSPPGNLLHGPGIPSGFGSDMVFCAILGIGG